MAYLIKAFHTVNVARIQAVAFTHQWVEAQFLSWGAASTSASPHTAWLWRGWWNGTQTSCWGLWPAFDTEDETTIHGTELEEIHVSALTCTFRETQRRQHVFLSHTNDVCWGGALIIKILRSCPKWNDTCWSSSSTKHMLEEKFHVWNASELPLVSLEKNTPAFSITGLASSGRLWTFEGPGQK